MGKTIVKRDEEIELTHVDGDLEVQDGAIITVPTGFDRLTIEGELFSSGDITIKGSVLAEEISHENGYLEIEGDVKAVEVNVSSRGNDSKLIIAGILETKKADIDGGIEIEKNLLCEDLEVRGGCQVHGETNVIKYEISGGAKHGLDIKAEEIEINGSLKASGNVIVKNDFEVSGSAKIEGTLEASKIDVGGSLTCYELKTESIEIGGSAKLEIAKIEKELDVGGAFKCQSSIIAPKVTCGGACGFGENSEIDELKINGSTRVGSNFKFGTIKVNGSFTMEENAQGENLIINGSCNSEGTLKLKNKLEINGSKHSEFIEADEIIVRGTMETDQAKGRLIQITKNSRVRGTLIGERVVVEEFARVDHIIADEVEIGKDARIGKLEAKNINADPSAKY